MLISGSGGHRGYLRTDGQPEEQVDRPIVVDLVGQFLPIVLEAGLGTWFARRGEQVYLDTAIAQRIGGRPHVAADSGAGNNQHARHGRSDMWAGQGAAAWLSSRSTT